MKKQKILKVIIIIGVVFLLLQGKSYAVHLNRDITTAKSSIVATNINVYPTVTYTGREVSPSVIIKDGGYVLRKGIDYILTYINNKDVGKGTIIISGRGNYIGEVRKSFYIVARDICTTKVTGIKTRTYTGKSITQSPTVYYNGQYLRNGKDYTLSYKYNKNSGKATIYINGKGNYKGTIKKTFYIVARDIKKAKVTGVKTKTYTGKSIKQYPTVRYSGQKLKNGKDYTISYKYNRSPGKATIYIKGKGNYKGTIKKTFSIKPRTPKIKKVSKKTSTSLKITWGRDSKASRYAIYMSTSKNGKYKRIKTIKSNKTTSYTKKGLSKNKTYYFKIRSYKMIKGKDVYSNYSSAKTNSKLLVSKKLVSRSNTNRNKNLKLAAKACNGIVLKPGQKFTWSKVVGRASKSKGYKKAIIFEGKRAVKGYGGGICQVSTSIYQCAKATKLKIIERHKHSKPVSYAKRGQEATVAYGSKDLVIKNNKSYSIKIVLTTYKGQCTCKFYRID